MYSFGGAEIGVAVRETLCETRVDGVRESRDHEFERVDVDLSGFSL